MSIIIRLQNLPWSANAMDVRQYFQNLSIPDGGVHIIGGENGDVFIAFSSDEDARQAMLLDGGKIKETKIKVLLSSRSEMQTVIEQARQQAFNMQSIMQMTAPTAFPSTIASGVTFPPTAAAPAVQLPTVPILPAAMMQNLIQSAVPTSITMGTTPTTSITIPTSLTAAATTTNKVEDQQNDKDNRQYKKDESSSRKVSLSKDHSASNSKSRTRSRSRSRSRDRRHHRDRYRNRDRSRDRRRRRDRTRSRDRDRSTGDDRDKRSRSRDRHYRRSRSRDRKFRGQNEKERDSRDSRTKDKQKSRRSPSSRDNNTKNAPVPVVCDPRFKPIPESQKLTPTDVKVPVPIIENDDNKNQDARFKMAFHSRPIPQTKSVQNENPAQVSENDMEPDRNPVGITQNSKLGDWIPAMPLTMMPQIPWSVNAVNAKISNNKTKDEPLLTPVSPDDMDESEDGEDAITQKKDAVTTTAIGPTTMLMPPPFNGIIPFGYPPAVMQGDSMAQMKLHSLYPNFQTNTVMPGFPNPNFPHFAPRDPSYIGQFRAPFIPYQTQHPESNTTANNIGYHTQGNKNLPNIYESKSPEEQTFSSMSNKIAPSNFSTQLKTDFSPFNNKYSNQSYQDGKNSNESSYSGTRLTKEFQGPPPQMFGTQPNRYTPAMGKESSAPGSYPVRGIRPPFNDRPAKGSLDRPQSDSSKPLFKKGTQLYKYNEQENESPYTNAEEGQQNNYKDRNFNNGPNSDYSYSRKPFIKQFNSDQQPNEYNKNTSYGNSNYSRGTFKKDFDSRGTRFSSDPRSNRNDSNQWSSQYNPDCMQPNSEVRERNDPRNSADVCIELRNVPLNATVGDIKTFLGQNFPLPASSIKFPTDNKGNKIGIAYVKCLNITYKNDAISLNGNMMNGSPVEVLHLDKKIYETTTDMSSQNITPYIKVDNVPVVALEDDVSKQFLAYAMPKDIVMLENNDKQSKTVFLRFESKDITEKIINDNIKFSICNKPVNVQGSTERLFNLAIEMRNKGETVILENNVFGEGYLFDSNISKPSYIRNDPRINKNCSNCILIKNLPAKLCNNEDIKSCFETVNIVPLRIHVLFDANYEPTGESFCEFKNVDDAKIALSKNNTQLEGSTVTLQSVLREEMLEAIGTPISEAQKEIDRNKRNEDGNFIPKPHNHRLGTHPPYSSDRQKPPYQHKNHLHTLPDPEVFGKPGCVVLLQNIPYRAEIEELLDFFHYHKFNVHRGDVIRRYNEDEQPTGDAKVSLKSPQDAQRAVKFLNNKTIRRRPISVTLLQ